LSAGSLLAVTAEVLIDLESSVTRPAQLTSPRRAGACSRLGRLTAANDNAPGGVRWTPIGR